jgi:hypothetical protein
MPESLNTNSPAVEAPIKLSGVLISISSAALPGMLGDLCG